VVTLPDPIETLQAQEPSGFQRIAKTPYFESEFTRHAGKEDYEGAQAAPPAPTVWTVKTIIIDGLVRNFLNPKDA